MSQDDNLATTENQQENGDLDSNIDTLATAKAKYKPPVFSKSKYQEMQKNSIKKKMENKKSIRSPQDLRDFILRVLNRLNEKERSNEEKLTSVDMRTIVDLTNSYLKLHDYTLEEDTLKQLKQGKK